MNRRRWKRIALTAVAVLAVAISFFWAGCNRKSIPTGSSDTPVILISIDTLRSDHLPAYGYTGVETPNIDSFRSDAILYERAYSHCPLTLPSHASVFTGLLPGEIGLRDNIGFRLQEKYPTLPAILKQTGYATGAAVSAFVLRSETGMNRGFDSYDDDVEAVGPSRVMGRIQRHGADTVKTAETWIEKNASRPFFFFLHLYEPHSPYDPPEPIRSKYALAYDGEIALTDQALGSFFDFLKKKDLYDRSLIILFSDHGEGLKDHQEEEHGLLLYREAIQVPMIVKLPKSRFGGAKVSAPVQLIDIFPTVVDQTKSKVDVTGLHGRSLLETFVKPSTRLVYSETYYPRFHFGWSELHSLTDGKNHFISAPKPELFDVESDPSESKNILLDNRRTYLAMKKAMEPLIKEAEGPSAIDPEDAAKLAALGYLGSTVQTQPGEQLPDPKDKIGTFHEIQLAFTLNSRREYQKSLEIVDRLLAENGRMTDLWDLKSRALARLGRTEEAIAAAQQGLKLSPASMHLAISLANLYLDAEKPDEALRHAELALKAEPGPAREALARVYIAKGDLDRAEKEARLSLEQNEDRVAAIMTLGRIAKARGNYEAALRYFDQADAALKDKHSVTMLNFMRGDTFARLGRNADAEKAFREEIRLFPENPQTYKNLILLYVSEDRLPEATALIYDLVKANPAPPSYAAVAETLKVVGDRRGARYWLRQGLLKFPNDRSLAKLSATL